MRLCCDKYKPNNRSLTTIVKCADCLRDIVSGELIAPHTNSLHKGVACVWCLGVS